MARRSDLDPRATARVQQLRASSLSGLASLDPDVLDPDLLDLDAVSSRPRRALAGPATPGADTVSWEPFALPDLDPSPDHDADPSGAAGDDRLTSAERWRARRPFGRPQLAVVGCLVVLALLLAGWAVLRARPVALAEPIHAAGPTADATATDRAAPSNTSANPSSNPASSASSVPSATPSVTHSADSSADAPATSSGQSSEPTIEVHVLGAVARPGLVRLPAGARVADALSAAGGLRQANPGRLNLAQPLSDGQQLYLARRGHSGSEIRDPEAAGSSGSTAGSGDPGSTTTSSSRGSGAASTSGTSAKVNINQADATQLDELPGVGPVTAGKIVAWRSQHGRFSRVEELQEVDGIGPKTYADLAGQVTV